MLLSFPRANLGRSFGWPCADIHRLGNSQDVRRLNQTLGRLRLFVIQKNIKVSLCNKLGPLVMEGDHVLPCYLVPQSIGQLF